MKFKEKWNEAHDNLWAQLSSSFKLIKEAFQEGIIQWEDKDEGK